MEIRDLLISLAVTAFNHQYNKRLLFNDFDIRSIQPHSNSVLAYELESTRFDDFLRLRIYLNISNVNSVSRYRLENDSSNHSNELGDEIFVSDGTIDRYFIKEKNIQQFINLGSDITRLEVYLTNDNEVLITDDGEYLLLEYGV
jgi:hypothetical protein